MKIKLRYFAALVTAAIAMPVVVGAAEPSPVNPDLVRKLEQRLDEMQLQLGAMKAQIQELKSQNQALKTAQQQLALLPQAALAQVASAQSAQSKTAEPTGGQWAASENPWPAGGGISENMSLWGYGEIYYTHPTHEGRNTQFDLARAVFGIGYRFDDRTMFNSEFEVEHAVSSADDKGEFEVEQFFVEHQLAPWASVKGGLFLMPFGLLNEHHEPTNYFGVQRNFVETLIIPSTWREGGVGLHGNTEMGLDWDVGLTTGLNLAGWNVNPEDPLYHTALDLENSGAAPMQATHQELSLANGHHLSQYVSLNYSGVPGLLAGAAVFTGNVTVPSLPVNLPNERATLWEGHARWTPGAAELSALYARGRFSNTSTFNVVNAGASNPLPAEFLGYYLQGAYTVWQDGGARLAPFARWEHYDMGSSYEGIAQGFTIVPAGLAADGKPWPQPRDRVWTFGANYYLTPKVVFKVDYQTFDVNKDLTRFDLGLGVAF
ncbi:MAG: porin [Gammaproteobacteria bacterium]